MRRSLARRAAASRAGASIAALLLGLGAAAGTAHAHRTEARFLLDGALGVSIPLADASYEDAFLPSPKFALRLGAEIWLRPHFGLAPELSLDGGPLISQNATSVTTGRFRFQPGLRALFGFGRGHAFFLRLLVGGELFVFGPGGRGGAGTTNLGPSVEPGFGMQFRVARHAVVGFTGGFPVATHTFGTPVSSTDVDFDLCAFVGLRR